MLTFDTSSSEWETEGRIPVVPKGGSRRLLVRRMGRGKRERKEGCAALRLGRDDGGLSVATQARQLREALGRVRGAHRRGDGERGVGTEGWQVAAMRAVRGGESFCIEPRARRGRLGSQQGGLRTQ